MKVTTKENGITLIALIITIIIMIILAGIAMSFALGDNGIIGKSRGAVNIWNTAVENEMEMLNNLLGRIEGEEEIDLEEEYPEVTEWIPIYTKEQLAKVGSEETVVIEQEGNQEHVFSKQGAYMLKNDIDLEGTNWEPLTPTEEGRFTGIFLGNNKIIKNMTIIQTYESYDLYVGLFGCFGGTIANLGLVDINIDIKNNMEYNGGYIGGIAGRGLIEEEQEKVIEIKNCYTTGKIKIDKIEVVGGIIGKIDNYNWNGNVEDYNHNLVLYNLVNSTQIDGNTDRTGGIIGWLTGSAKILKCQNKGNINNNSADYIGGIIGWFGTFMAEIKDCNNSGDINGNNSKIGGIVGNFTGNYVEIQRCYNSGKIEGNSVAGICGDLLSENGIIKDCYNAGNITAINNVAGIVLVFASNKEIANCYSSGKITSTNGFTMGVGISQGGKLKNCYWYKAESNIDSIVGEYATIIENVKELTLQEMKTKDSFVGFDFTNIWKIEEGVNFPIFK